MRLVGLRLDKIERPINTCQQNITVREIAKLIKRIPELPQTSIVILEATAALNRLTEENFWVTINHQKLEFLRLEIKPLFQRMSDIDFKVMRFERDLLEYSTTILCEDNGKAETIKEGIAEQISELPLSISFVKVEESLIREM